MPESIYSPNMLTEEQVRWAEEEAAKEAQALLEQQQAEEEAQSLSGGETGPSARAQAAGRGSEAARVCAGWTIPLTRLQRKVEAVEERGGG